MAGFINVDEQKRQEQYRNWKASQNALDKLDPNAKKKAPGKQGKKQLVTTILVVGCIIVALVIVSRLMQ